MRSKENQNPEARQVARIGSWLLFSLWSVAAFAQPSIEFTVDQNEVMLGEGFNAQVSIRGAQRAGEPQIDGLGAFESERAGTANQVQIINGVTTLSVTFNYVIVPKTVGTFTLGPARATVGGIAVVSDPIQIRVVAGNQQAQAGKAPAAEKPYLVLADVDKQQVYLGQQILYTFQFMSRGQMQNAQLNLPDFKGFLKEELGKQRQYETVRNGRQWSVSEFKVALFPTQTGDRPIEPSTLTGEALVEERGSRRGTPFDDFFDSGFFGRHGQLKRVRLQSPGFIVKVSDLPAAGKPASFSGVVGSLSIRQTLSKTSVSVGDSVTWSVELSGVGNIRDARWEAPPLTAFKAYDDQPGFHLTINNNRLGGTKFFKKALVPLQGGKLEIPALEIGYFDPDEGAYKIAKALPLTLDVSGQASSVPLGGPARQAVAVRGEDILAPRWEAAEVEKDALTSGERLKLAIIWALGPLLFGLTWGGMGWRRRRLGDTVQLRRSRAFGSFRKASAAWNGSASFDGLDGAFRAYLGDRFNTDGGALTPMDVRAKLGRFGLSDTLVKETEAVLDLCERGRYGGGGDPAEVRQRVLSLVEGLEKEVRS